MSTTIHDSHFGYGRVNVARALAMGADTQWTQVVEGEHTNGMGDDNTARAIFYFCLLSHGKATEKK